METNAFGPYIYQGSKLKSSSLLPPLTIDARRPQRCCFCRTDLSHRRCCQPEWSTSSPWARPGSSAAAYTPDCRRPPHPCANTKSL